MELSKGPVPSQPILRAIARAQVYPRLADPERMVILGTLLEAVLKVGHDFPRGLLNFGKGTEFVGFMSLVDEVREDMALHFYGKSTAQTNENTLHKLGLVFGELEFYLSNADLPSLDNTINAAGGAVRAARDFYNSTQQGDDFKKAWAASGNLPRQSPFTAFNITNEIMTYTIPRIQKSFPDLMKRTQDDVWQEILSTVHRTLYKEDQTLGRATAENVDYACIHLGRMATQIEKLVMSLRVSELPKASKSMDFLALHALRAYTLPYLPREESPAPVSADNPDNMCRMEDFKRSRVGTGPYAPRPL